MLNSLRPLLAAPLVVTAATTAYAENLSSPASFCRGPASALVYWDGEFANPATNVMDANCPVVTSSVAPVVKSAKVVVRDRNRTADVVCRVTTQWYSTGGVVNWYESAPMKSSGLSSPTQTLWASVNFGALGENLNFQCQIPGKTADGVSSIFRYEVVR